MDVPTQSPTEYITFEVNEWMESQYAQKAIDLATADFGQIHFAKNDRKSWYVRFPFALTKTDGKSNQPQPNSLQRQESKPQLSVSKTKITKKNVYSVLIDEPQTDEDISNDKGGEIKQQENMSESTSWPDNQEENNGALKDPQTTQTNHVSVISEVYCRQYRSELRQTDENQDDEKKLTEEKPITFQAAEIVDFMRNAWKLPVPELIISVTGGAKLFEIVSSRAHKTFQQDLVSVALATNAWVFTAGTNSGVIKEVGDAYDKCRYKNTKIASKIPYIGVVSWYATAGYKQLEQNQHKSRSENKPDHSTLLKKDSKDRVRLYRTPQPSTNEDPGTYPLDHNHTHFLMLQDDCVEDCKKKKKSGNHDQLRSDLILPLRAEIEEESRKIINQGEIYSIPMVQILINGGVSSILTICASIKRKTPVIVVNGSGRAADLIAIEYKYLYGEEKVRSKEAYEVATKSIEFQDYENKKKSEPDLKESVIIDRNRPQFIQMMTSIEGYFLLNSFELFHGNEQSKLDDAIMKAQLNAALMTDNKREQETKKLRLAIAWNKYDRVTNDILTNQAAPNWSDADLDDALRNALRRNSINFVDILIAYGASFQRLHRLINIADLYQDLDKNDLQAKLPPGKNRYSTAISLIEKIPLLPNKVKDRILNEYEKQKNTMKFQYNTTYFGQKVTIHHPDFEQMISHCATDNAYGIIANFETSDTNFNNKLVFSYNDIIRKSGHVTELSIDFSKSPDESHPSSIPSIFLYVISPTKEKDHFVIIYRHEIPEKQIQQLLNNKTESENPIITDSDIRTITICEPTLYLEAGQFLGVGFRRYSGHSRVVKGSDSYYIDLNTDNIGLKKGKSELFNRAENCCATFSFTIRPSSNFIRDLLLWSLFVDRSKLTTCLCSHSENTIVATLLSSKIYQIASEIEHKEEKKKDYLRKAREFDNHAARIIDACYNIEEDFAVDILTANSNLYFNYSPLELAKQNNSRSFLATKCVQKYLDKQWYGKVSNDGHVAYFIDILIFILCLLPAMIPIVAKFSKTLALTKEKHEPSSASGCSVFRFYHKRPIIRFHYNIIFYIAFLGLFSYVLLVDYFPRNNNGGKRNGLTNLGIPITEILLHISTLGIVVEEIDEFRLFYVEKSAYNGDSIVWKYFTDDNWNVLDMVAILFYLVGFATRFVVMESFFVASKIAMCIALFLWYVRILHLFIASERLGTKLLMICNTMKDLLFFVCFILVFLIGYSVTSYSLVTTKQQVIWNKTSGNSSSTTYTLANGGSGLWNWTIVRNVIDWGMWKVYGQVDLLDHEQVDDNTLNVDNDAYGTTIFILTIVFVCVANVLLLNVLVALFNVTLDKTKDHAHISWAYRRFLLVNEYSKKSPVPPPFNLLYYIAMLIKYLIGRRKNKFNNHICGSLDNTAGLDFDIGNTVIYNGMDQVKIIDVPESSQSPYCWWPRRTNKNKETTDSDQQDSSFIANPRSYQTYDNMLREQSIAHDYWTDVIDQLKKEEKDANKHYMLRKIIGNK